MELTMGRWKEISTNSISLENIRLLYQPKNKYRVSWNKYEAKTEFDGSQIEGRIYVLSGCCTIQIEQKSWQICEEQFLDFPKGKFHFSVSDKSNVEIVKVWEIPEEFRV